MTDTSAILPDAILGENELGEIKTAYKDGDWNVSHRASRRLVEKVPRLLACVRALQAQNKALQAQVEMLEVDRQAANAFAEMRRTWLERKTLNWSGDICPMAAIMDALLSDDSDAEKLTKIEAGILKHRHYYRDRLGADNATD